MPSLYDFAGGQQALHRLEDTFYNSMLIDPLLQPLFGAGQPQHVDHLTAFTAESFGGPGRFTRELGFAHLINVHRHLRITEEQRQRFVDLYLAAMDAADMPDDEDFREAVRSHVEFSSKWQWRTHLRRRMKSSIRCVRFLDGRGRETTRRDSLPCSTR